MQKESLPHPYIGIHLRRNDWAFAHADTMPTVEATVAILRGLKERRGPRWTSAPWFLLRPGRLGLPGGSKAPGRSY